LNDNWYKLDNVAKVFLANHSVRNPQSLRVSYTLTEDIKPEILQAALDNAILTCPQFQVRIRRGFFWHYMEDTMERPIVTEEKGRPCPTLYGSGHDGSYLHYRVTYYKKRINLDMFHAISDGTGALQFLELIVFNYLKLLYPSEFEHVSLGSEATSEDRSQNSFAHFYDDSDGPIPKTILNKKKKAYHFLSRKLPYDQLQFFEIHMETEPIRKAAKELGVSVTSYLGAQLMLAIRGGMPFLERKRPVTISMPVNLRNYYPSTTLRNFFNNVDVSHSFDGNETLEDLAWEFDKKFKASLEPELINAQMNRYQSIEKLFFTRMVPLAIKQPVVKAFSKKEKKTVTAVLSNLGVVKIPLEMQKYVTGISDFCSTESLFITTTSYGDDFVFGITSAYTSTATIRRLINQLKATGTSVTACVSEAIL